MSTLITTPTKTHETDCPTHNERRNYSPFDYCHFGRPSSDGIGWFILCIREKDEMNIAIIGTAGRDEDGKRLQGEHFGAMWLAVNRLIKTELAKGEPYGLVSGGAAWADHIAVYDFILGNADSLDLELPCQITSEGKFVDTGIRDFRTNPGGTSNYYHELFSKKIGFSSFNQLRIAIEAPECVITAGGGFFDRNSKVAEKADHTIALTFGKGAELKDGGTMDTMKKFQKKGTGKSFHIDLHDWKVYSPAIVK